MRRSRIFAALITLAWLATMTALIQRHYAPSDTPSTAKAPPEWMLEENWMGIYHGTNKVGHAVTKLDHTDDGYMFTETSFMRLTVMGVEKEMTTSTEALLDKGLRLKSFTFALDSDVSIRVEGTLEGKELLMALDMGGVKTEKKLHMPDPPFMSPDLSLLLEDPTPGRRLRFPVMSPASMTGDYMEVEVLSREQVTAMGLRQEAFKLRATFMGTEITTWAKKSGEILKQEAMGFTYLKESEEEARKIGTASIDLIADISVPVDKEIPDGVEYLKVRLKGIDPEKFELEGGAQTLSDDDVLEIKIPRSIKNAGASQGMDEYLDASFLIESDDPAIVSLAEDITKDQKNPVDKARLVSEWVFAELDKVPTITIPSALEVLQSRRGDCNEHTALYTALARAAGVPTRVAVGVVHKDGYFYYHAWPEIHMGGWVPVDPTLGQFPADATHIRLLTGGLEKQLQIGSAIGKLEIEVLEYR
jgi:hypothetical protein